MLLDRVLLVKEVVGVLEILDVVGLLEVLEVVGFEELVLLTTELDDLVVLLVEVVILKVEAAGPQRPAVASQFAPQ